jgi:TonB family protein
MSWKSEAASLLLCIFAVTPPATTAYSQEMPFELPAVVKAVAPVYPTMILGTFGEVDKSGGVIVETQLDASGGVVSAEAVSGRSPLKSAAVEAARRWRFAPAAQSGGGRTVRIFFNFQTLPLDAPSSSLAASFTFGSTYRVDVSRYSVEERARSRNSRPKRLSK